VTVLVLGFGIWGTPLLAFAGPGNDIARGALAADSAPDFSRRIRAWSEARGGDGEETRMARSFDR
jgi:hypothetical protein